ncbi:MAG: type IV pilus secretin PilQ [Deltaproteobacteria bacterium]|nr:type IV pilus secretin PilQ [Deltaproteobacteria bacterium]
MSLREVRLRQALFAMVLGGSLAVTGCASTGTMGTGEAEKTQAQAADEAASVNVAEAVAQRVAVEYVNVVGDGDRVLIGTTGQVRYTVFKLSDPSRLIIDMPGVDLSRVSSPMSVGNDYLGDITAVTYGDDKDIGRIIIALNDNVDHEVKTGDNSILVSLVKTAPQPTGSVVSASVETVAQEPVVEAVPEKPVEVASSAIDESASSAPSEEASTEGRAATMATKVSSSKDGANTVITIATDGVASGYNSFVLTDPARIVVDVPGVMNSTGKDSQKLSGQYVKAVRIGSYSDKTRFVFDGSVKKLPPHSITAENGALVIAIGPDVEPSAQSKAAPVPVAQARKAVSAPAPEPVKAVEVERAPVDEGQRVEAVDFKKVGDKGRLSIVSSGKPEYRIREGKDGKTVVLDIKNASIAETLTRTLDASKLNTAVVSVSSYQESLNPRSVRVLVKLKDKSSYSVQELENSIAVDFAQLEAAPLVEPAPKGIVLNDKSFTGKRIDLDMMDANVSDVLRLLAEISNLNIVASDDVKGTISLRLKNVPWDQAFDIILKAKGLDSIVEGNVIRVAPALRIRQERESVLASRKAEEKLENMEIEFVPVNYATAEDLIKQVKGVLSDRGDVTTDTRTNMLIIKDIRNGIDKAKNVVTKLDTAIPQVLIEARIVEASSSFARDLGIQWGVDFQTSGGTRTTTMGSTSTTGQTFAAPSTLPTFTNATGAQKFAVNLPASGNAGTLGAIGFMLGKAGVNPVVLDLRLSAGESQGQLKTISRPRITTLDNKEATIEQGESIPFETTSAAGTATMFVDAKLSLKVTPHITPDGSVLMKIEATRNSIGTFTTSDGQPSINKKESKTEVLVKDGETTVIGGIVITDKNNQEKGIPYLKDIPLLGWLFKNKSVSDSQQELLIFITPKIIKDKTVG